MCGRCTSVCPAHATGKPLDPREIVLKAGEVMAAVRPRPRCRPPIGPRPGDHRRRRTRVFERITAEEVWACTTCKACDEICPVNIEILDKILDMRRYLSLMESNFPTELGTAYRSMENSGNPWGMSQSDRAAWSNKLDGIDIVDGSGPFDHEYLYWVGCAGSLRRQEPEGHPGHGQADAAGRRSTSPSSARPRTAPATRPAAPATSTSSRCSPCRTSRRSTAWA